MLILRTGEQLELAHATIRADSIIGMSTSNGVETRAAYARDDVVRLESLERDASPVLHAGGSFLAELGSALGAMVRCVYTFFRWC
jgi:hypothetical protein